MVDLLRPDWWFLVLAGPCVGSFIGLLADRLPAGRPVVRGRSACDHCGGVLGLRDLVPIFGWLARRGRCRRCGQRISPLYPAIEIGAGAIAVWALAVLPGWTAWAGAALGWTLLALALIDVRAMELPDRLTLPLIPAGLAVAWAVGADRLAHHAAGAAAGFLLVVLVGLAYRLARRREGIGFGDAKLMAAAGAWVSWEGLAGVLLLAAVGGLVGALARARLAGAASIARPLPFGPYIAGALWLTWLYGPLQLG